MTNLKQSAYKHFHGAGLKKVGNYRSSFSFLGGSFLLGSWRSLQLLLGPVLLAGVDLVAKAEGHALGLGTDTNVACK